MCCVSADSLHWMCSLIHPLHYHLYCVDIIATVLAVEPMRFIYRGRIAVFSIKVLRDERVCVIAEQRPDCSEEESFQWMSRVLQAVDSIHQVGIYCLALVPPNHLPKTPLGKSILKKRKRAHHNNIHVRFCVVNR